MTVSNVDLTNIGTNLGRAIEKAMAEDTPKVIALDLATAQAVFAITQELVAFRIDYPDVNYMKTIEDQYGLRGEQ